MRGEKMGQDYSPEDVQLLEKDFTAINDKWNEFVLWKTDGRDSDLHNPPALNRAISELLEFILTRKIYDEDDEGLVLTSLDIFGMFGANMFAFGQWAAENGLKMSDMFACRCSTITDQDIRDLSKK